MLYLADYFAVISTKVDGDEESPFISLKVPSDNSIEFGPFPGGIELFALPNGWSIEQKWRQPVFHTAQCTKEGKLIQIINKFLNYK